MTHLDFLSPDLAAPEAAWRSPLERALAHAPDGIEDVSRTGVLEVRGDLSGLEPDGCEVVKLTPERALVLCSRERVGEKHASLSRQFHVTDLSAGWAGLSLRGQAALRRLTDLDPAALPAMGAVAHVQALVLRDDEETFRLFVPQEYGHFVAEVVVDAVRGLGAS
jgi:sarcosine oxidase gamma subunit